MEIRKLLYSMGEVSEMFDVNPSLIRYWETQFDDLKPKKNKKGNRLFTPEDVLTLKVIYHLVKERGMTLEGAKKCLKQNRGAAERDSELLERLLRIRSLLVEVREDLKAGRDELIVDDAPDAAQAEPSPAAMEPAPEKEKQPRPKRRRTAEVPEPEFEVEAGPRDDEPHTEETNSEQPNMEEQNSEEPRSEELPLEDVHSEELSAELPRSEELRREEPQFRSRRRKGRKDADAQEKELFAFYEQSLFKNNED